MDVGRIRESLENARQWLIRAGAPGGAFEQGALTYRGLFKAPLGFASVGLYAEGVRSVAHIKNHLLIRPDGDVADRPGMSADKHPAPSLAYFYPYRTGYITIGAQALRCYDVARRVGQFVLSLQYDSCGGFVARPGLDPPRFHIGGTAEAALAALAIGCWDAACNAGDFLIRVLERQGTGVECFYFVTDGQGTPVTDGAWGQDPNCRLAMGQPGQRSFMTGLSAGVLATLHRLTGERRFLEAAMTYQELTRRSHADALTNLACGKLSWASAMLYATTGDLAYRQDALTGAGTLCDVIATDPPMHAAALYPDYHTQPAPFTFEIAFEYAYWLSAILAELAE